MAYCYCYYTNDLQLGERLGHMCVAFGYGLAAAAAVLVVAVVTMLVVTAVLVGGRSDDT